MFQPSNDQQISSNDTFDVFEATLSRQQQQRLRASVDENSVAIEAFLSVPPSFKIATKASSSTSNRGWCLEHVDDDRLDIMNNSDDYDDKNCTTSLNDEIVSTSAAASTSMTITTNREEDELLENNINTCGKMRKWFKKMVKMVMPSHQSSLFLTIRIDDYPIQIHRLLKRATINGSISSQCRLGYIFDNSTNNLGVLLWTGHQNRMQPNLCESIYWFKRAAKSEIASAQFHLGRAYYSGKAGLQRDSVQALYYFKCAANQGHEMSMVNVGGIIISGGESGGVVSSKNAECGRKWFKRAVKMGNPVAAHNLAVMYKFGIGLNGQRDFVKSRQYKCIMQDLMRNAGSQYESSSLYQFLRVTCVDDH